MAQKFGNGVFTGVTAGAGASAGIPVSVLVNRIAGKKVSLDSLGRENASALSFTVIDTANGATAATQDQLIAKTYIPTQLPTGFYGSATPLVMLAKLKAGTDSVDFHVVGDSNTGSAATGNWGYSRGLGRGLYAGCCMGMYATGIHPAGVCNGASITEVFSADLNFRNWSNISPIGKVLSGNAYNHPLSAPEDISSFLNFLGNDTKLGFGHSNAISTIPYRTGFIWMPTSGYTYCSSEENYIHEYVADGTERQFGLDTGSTLSYRVVHSKVPGNTGSFAMYFGGATTGYGVCASGNALRTLSFWSTTSIGGAVGNLGFTYYPPASSSNQLGYRASANYGGVAGATAKTVSKLSWPADPNRVGMTLCYSWGGRNTGYTLSIGPVAVYLESVHSNKKGWAITPVSYLPGYTSGGIANSIQNAGLTTGSFSDNALKTILQETRERQIEAGGSGNVIVWVNSGVNDQSQLTESVAASNYQTHIRTIITTYKQQWENLGYPTNDLAFMISVTHPTIDGDTTLDSLRLKGQEYANTLPDANKQIDPYENVLFVNFQELGLTYGVLSVGNSFNGNSTFYRDSGNVHLTTGTTGGYDFVAETIIKKCLRYSVSY
jgi:lysophospholipase L1-like esterase